MAQNAQQLPIVGGEDIMSQKAHGTTEKPCQQNLLYGCDFETADRICCYNRHYAEHGGYSFQSPRTWLEFLSANPGEITYYDSVTGKPLFIAPRGRTVQQFIEESRKHGWPSFRDEEVIWDSVRCLANGETVSVDGTHLGHNLPSGGKNRYCINLVSVAGTPQQ